jgi:adenosylhomocysteine nucleosidase
VAERYGIPSLVVRSLSDLAGAESHMDFAAFCGAAAEGAAVLIRRLVGVV